MKILILHASAGAGHRRAAEALESEFKKNESVEVKVIDVLDLTDEKFKKSYGSGYEYIVKHFPWLWGIVYKVTDSDILRPIVFTWRSFINSLHSKKIENLIVEEKPDVVISTQFFSVEVITRMRNKGKAKDFKFYCVVTDFNVHAYWYSKQVDEYIVASEFTKDVLAKRFNIPEDIIRVFGIPVDAHFRVARDRIQLAEKFNTDLNKFTILIMAGTFGMGPLKKIALSLCEENQVIVGCGKNKKLLKELEILAKTRKTLIPIGFIDYVDELMAVSDCIITKPGGLTTSESLAMELPMIFISPIKGQETNNACLMVDLGIGYIPRNSQEIKRIIKKLREDPDLRLQIKDEIKKISSPNSAKLAVDYILEQHGA